MMYSENCQSVSFFSFRASDSKESRLPENATSPLFPHVNDVTSLQTYVTHDRWFISIFDWWKINPPTNYEKH